MNKIQNNLNLFIVYTLFIFICSCQNIINDSEDGILNYKYAPLQIGNNWSYLQISEYSSGHPGTLNDTIYYNGIYIHSIDTISFEVDSYFTINTDTFIVLTGTHIAIGTTILHFRESDSLITSKTFNEYKDTLHISGDSIIGNIFFNLVDYPDSCKKIIEFKNKKFEMAYFEAWNLKIYYLETYGLVKINNHIPGNGHNSNYTLRLIRFNKEVIDSVEIEAITH